LDIPPHSGEDTLSIDIGDSVVEVETLVEVIGEQDETLKLCTAESIPSI
jgi:hypothetical protein